MEIILYAGSLRPGGGLTVAKIIIDALAEGQSHKITVYTGAIDASLALQKLFKKYPNVKEKRFFGGLSSEARYLLSKFYFLPITLFKRSILIFSFNYFLPSFSKQFVYHINLLSFLRTDNDTLGKKLKELDANLACRFATINVFESDYLKQAAEQHIGRPIKNPKRLYIGIDEDFYTNSITQNKKAICANSQVIMVSSPQPHKDNETCVKALKLLYESNPQVDWRLIVAGGQSIKHWQALKKFADTIDMGDKIEFIGPVGKKKLSSLMQKSLCLITASKIESFCMVAVEAMASGCPTIVTNATSMPESVGDAAIIVDEGAEEQFANSILSLYFNPGRRNSLIKNGFAHAMNLSVEAFNRNLNEIINDI